MKQAHLLAANILAAVLLMYAVTGFVINHENLFGGEESVVKEVIPVHGAVADTSDLRLFARGSLHIHGKEGFLRLLDNGHIILNYCRPGHEYKLYFDSAQDSVWFTHHIAPAKVVLKKIHRTFGYEGPFIYRFHAFLVDVTAISLLLFFSTGVYMGLKVVRRKWLAYLVLVIAFAFAVAMYIGLASL